MTRTHASGGGRRAAAVKPPTQETSAGAPAGAAGLPEAVLRPKRRFPAAWLLPAATVVFVGWLGIAAWSGRGATVTVELDRGYGLKPGDDVRYRGITVGEVREVEVAEDLEGIVVTASLRSEADRLARQGSRFWVVRPQLGFGGIEGLETLVGPRYLAVLPGEGARRRSFVGFAEPPVVSPDESGPGALEVILEAPQQGRLRRGTPVTCRQVRVGTVLSVGLTSDAGGVEARLHVQQPFVQLVREDTRFWATGGIEAKVGMTGVSFQMQSLEELVTGGVALATPPDAGEVVRTGHRFVLEPKAPDDWVDWQPLAVIGSSMLPPGSPLPNPVRARVAWTRGGWLSRKRSRQGWVLRTSQGLLGPADLLQPDDEADRDSIVLEAAGEVVLLGGNPIWAEGGLAVIEAHLPGVTWPTQRRRAATQPEDCLAVGDPTATPLPLAEARLDPAEGGWLVDPAVSVDDSWHGAAVLARADGYLIGLLLLEDGVAKVALLPPAFVADGPGP